MTTYKWLLGFHLVGAFLFVSGAVLAGLLHSTAMRRERPSEVAAALGLARIGVAAIGIGAVVSLGPGIWLVDNLPGYDFGDAWIAASLVLWAASGALAAPGGRSLRKAREVAERLADEGDRPSGELRRAVTDPVALVLNYSSLALLLAILGLMVWKPA